MRSTFLLLSFLVATCASAQWTKHSITTPDTVTITYYTKGSGQPLLLLSGGPGFNADYLFSLADTLEHSKYYKDTKFIVPDLRGTGASPSRKDKITFNNITSDLELIRKKENLTQWIVLGHSYGGLLAEYYAVSHPPSVKAMLLLSGSAPDGGWAYNLYNQRKVRLWPAELEQIKRLNDAYNHSPDEKLLDQVNRITLPLYLANRQDTTRVMQVLANTKSNADCFDVLLSSGRVAKDTITKKASGVTCPVLILQGNLDPIGEGQAYENEKLFAKAQKQFMPGGHFLWVENPILFNVYAWQFLSRLMRER